LEITYLTPGNSVVFVKILKITHGIRRVLGSEDLQIADKSIILIDGRWDMFLASAVREFEYINPSLETTSKPALSESSWPMDGLLR